MSEVPTLRELARHQGFAIGSCVNARSLRSDTQYAATLSREFGVLTPENAMKFGHLSRAPGKYDFADADAVVAFAEKHNMAIRGHALIWHMQLPQWLARIKPDKRDLTRIMIDHICRVVHRYAGRIAAWDVVNEAIGTDGRPRNSIWHRVIGPDYIRMAFEAARSADPKALLFYNDFGIEATQIHRDAVDRWLATRSAQIPIDGVGMQMHLRLGDERDFDEMSGRMARLASMGLQSHVTELDIRLPDEMANHAAEHARQAIVYRKVVRACLDASNCDSLTVWGVTDRYSWIPHFFPGEGSALLFDRDYVRKPAYAAVAAELRIPLGDRNSDDHSSRYRRPLAK